MGAIIAVTACWMFAGCGRNENPEQVSPEYAAWQASLATRLSPTVLKLRNGDCLDTARLKTPWTADNYQGWFAVEAPAVSVNVKPYERPEFDTDFWGRPHDGKVHVQISGWRSDTDKFVQWHVPPSQVAANVADGVFTPIQLWADPRGMTAYKGVADSQYYFDARKITQCRDYVARPNEVDCQVVSADQQYTYGVQLDGSERSRLPQTLEKISHAIEAMRGPCPGAGSKDVSA
jgi:hypothetical protein